MKMKKEKCSKCLSLKEELKEANKEIKYLEKWNEKLYNLMTKAEKVLNERG